MAVKLSGAERDAILYLYGGGDEEIECWSASWVVTRFPQACYSLLHKGAHHFPAGTRAVAERAKVDGIFGTCYTCKECIEAAINELL